MTSAPSEITALKPNDTQMGTTIAWTAARRRGSCASWRMAMSMVVSPAMSNPSESSEKNTLASRWSIEATTVFAFAPCLTSMYLGPQGHCRLQN